MSFKATVIIPTLNEEKFIGGAIKSVVEQVFPFEDVDLIVVDGGSTDKTVQIVESIILEYPNVRLLNNPKKIQSAAFNIGVAASDAPYILRLDAHVLYDKNYISQVIARLESDECVGNVGGRLITKPSEESFQAKANAIVNQVRFGIGGAAFRVGASYGEVDSVPFGAFPRRVIESVGGMREDLPRGEDNEYNTRIRHAGYKIIFDPEIVSTYFARPTIRTSCHQMYANGVSVGHLIHVAPNSVSLRHCVPCMFVMSLIISALLACFYPVGWIMLGAILGLYFGTNIMASILVCIKFGWKYIIILPVMFFAVHTSYGVGTLVGLISKRQVAA